MKTIHPIASPEGYTAMSNFDTQLIHEQRDFPITSISDLSTLCYDIATLIISYAVQTNNVNNPFEPFLA